MSNDNSKDTVVISCRIDLETEAIIDSMADDLKVTRGTMGSLILKFGTRWAKQQVLDAAKGDRDV